jgi:hypothetical protein
VIGDVESFHNRNLVFIVEQNQNLKLRTVFDLNKQLVLEVVVGFHEGKLEAFAEVGLEIPKLVDELVGGNKSEVFGPGAEYGLRYLGKIDQIDDVDRVEVVIGVVADLMHAVVANNHEVAHLLVIKMGDYLPNGNRPTIVPVLAIHILILQIHLVYVLELVKDKQVGLATQIETLMPRDAGSVKTVVLAYVPKEHRETDDLVIDREVNLLLLGVVVVVGHEVELHLLLNRYLLQTEYQHVSLVHHKLSLRYLVTPQMFVLHLYDVRQRIGLVHRLGSLVNQPHLVRLIADQHRIEIGKDLEVNDNPVDLQGPYPKTGLAAVDREDCNRFLLACQVKRILLLAIPENVDDLMVRKFGVLPFRQVLVVKGYLVASHETDRGERHDLEHHTYAEVVAVDGSLLNHLLRLQPYLLHIE